MADERRLPVPPRRDEKHLLARGEIADEPIELGDAVHERGDRHDLAVDEGIVHYGK